MIRPDLRGDDLLDVYAGLFGDDLDTVADRLDPAVSRTDADRMRTAAVDGPATPTRP